MKSHWSHALFVSVFLLPFSPSLEAEEINEPQTWPQWRGPQRDGHSGGTAWPQSFENLKSLWHMPLGPGYPGPIVAADRVFVVESSDAETVAVRALDRQTGTQLWTARWQGRGSVPFFARANGDWVRSTPVWDGQTLYVGDMNEVLVALDGATGAQRWRVDFPARYGTEVPSFGFVCSPLIDGDFLYVQAANSLVKVDKKSGRSIWRQLQHSDDIGANGAFSSPVLVTLAGSRQLLVQTRETLFGLEPEMGEVLWSQSLPHFRGMHILTPTVVGDAVFTSPYRQQSYMVGISKNDTGFEAVPLWTNKASGYMSSPVVVDGHIYLHLGNERLDCIDAQTGVSRWRTQRRLGKYWSMVWQADKILGLNQDGTLFLLEANTERFELLDERRLVDDETWAHLAVSGEQLFVRGLKGITAYQWSPSTSTQQQSDTSTLKASLMP